jgi:hypothetical protein
MFQEKNDDGNGELRSKSRNKARTEVWWASMSET